MFDVRIMNSTIRSSLVAASSGGSMGGGGGDRPPPDLGEGDFSKYGGIFPLDVSMFIAFLCTAIDEILKVGVNDF
jgi:hypothetical protein